MAGSLNKVTLIGNLGRDPEQRTFQNGGQVVNLKIATSETWKDKQTGERKERTEWHSVAIMSDPLCKIAMEYLGKGSKVYIEGQIETRKWQDQSGNDRYSTEIALRPFKSTLIMLDGTQSREQERPQGGGDQGGYGSQGGYGGGDMDDEIPFAPEVRI